MQIDVLNKREQAYQLIRKIQITQSILKIKIDEFTTYTMNSTCDLTRINKKTRKLISAYMAMLVIQEIILTALSNTPPNGKVILSTELAGVLCDYGLSSR
ncbi:hypothetical protein AD947_01315 [Acetobacter tropicalis]|uniref:Uncharacterized protein n=1 Tax=Acetobacter tropicalis TaxID=104102 RepID=A0A149U6U1_9PROT|nr:hypothetical protein AD947_01315 [Acetobacter tropicalis]